MHNLFAIQHLVGQSHWTDRTRRRILQAARYNYPVLITGPAGTGKRLIARAIHLHSSRSKQPLIPFHCGQHIDVIARLQLFGHAAGAGALARGAAIGCVGAAQQGTLLLHEVGDLDLISQDRLLRLLHDRRHASVGVSEETRIDVRIIATSSRDLDDDAQAGRFRLPLLYALRAISVPALPLSQRPEDIEPLARRILARVTLEHGLPDYRLTPEALALLQVYDWPGNVRQLETVLSDAVRNGRGSLLDLDDFADLFAAVQQQAREAKCPERMDQPVNRYERISGASAVAGRWPTLEQLEADHLRTTLRRSGQNLNIAARLLGLEPAELRARLVRHRILLPAGLVALSDSGVG